MERKANDMLEEEERQTLAEFLESTPPNQNVEVPDLAEIKYVGTRKIDAIRKPELQLHCSNERCNGTRFFRCISVSPEELSADRISFIYFKYRCSNCQTDIKIFAIGAHLNSDYESSGRCFKFGEIPPYGPPTPSKLIELIGPDREEFLQGRRCENQGLGVGSFTYYRRVVENQRDRILGKILKVSEMIGAPKDNIDVLRAAMKETQFNKSLSMVKDVMPESLLINGHNPITLLHSALSEGIHSLSDEQCLELASSVRVVLGELSERLGQALKDEAELTKALSTLMNRK